MAKLGFAFLFYLVLVADSDSAASTMCEDYSVRLVGSSPERLQVQVIGEGSSFTIDIPGHTLPVQCQQNPSRCHTFIREEGVERQRYLAISAVGNVIVVDLEAQVWYIVSTSTPEMDRPRCDPVDLFAVIDANLPYLSAACEDASGSALVYLPYVLTIGESELMAFESLPSPVLASTSGFSQTVLIPNSFCSRSQDSTFFVVADNVVHSFPATGPTTGEFIERLRLQDCPVVSYIEYLGTSGNFIVHCSNGVAVNYSTCTDVAEYHYLAVGGLPFSSSSSLTAMYRTDSIDVIQSSNGSAVSSLNHTVGGIRFGRCLGGFFAAVATNGSLYVISLITGEVSAAIAQVCGSEDSCVLPSFDSGGFTVYDFQNSSLFSVSFVEGCEHPIVEFPNDTSLLLPSFISATSIGQRGCECPDGAMPTDATDTTTPLENMPEDISPPDGIAPPDGSTTPPDDPTTPQTTPPDDPMTPQTTPPKDPTTPPDDPMTPQTTPPDDPQDNMTTPPRVATTTPPDSVTTPPTVTTNNIMTTPDGTELTTEVTSRVNGTESERSISAMLTIILVPIFLAVAVVGIPICIIVILCVRSKRRKTTREIHARTRFPSSSDVPNGVPLVAATNLYTPPRVITTQLSTSPDKSDLSIESTNLTAPPQPQATSDPAAPATPSLPQDASDQLSQDGTSLRITPQEISIAPTLSQETSSLPSLNLAPATVGQPTPPQAGISVSPETSSMPTLLQDFPSPVEATPSQPRATVGQLTPPQAGISVSPGTSSMPTLLQDFPSPVEATSGQPCATVGQPTPQDSQTTLPHNATSVIPDLPGLETSGPPSPSLVIPGLPVLLLATCGPPTPFQATSGALNNLATATQDERESAQRRRNRLPSDRSISSEPASPVCSSPHDAHGSGHGAGLVTGYSNTVLPKTMITSETVNENIEKDSSTDDKRNDTDAKIRQLR